MAGARFSDGAGATQIVTFTGASSVEYAGGDGEVRALGGGSFEAASMGAHRVFRADGRLVQVTLRSEGEPGDGVEVLQASAGETESSGGGQLPFALVGAACAAVVVAAAVAFATRRRSLLSRGVPGNDAAALSRAAAASSSLSLAVSPPSVEGEADETAQQGPCLDDRISFETLSGVADAYAAREEE